LPTLFATHPFIDPVECIDCGACVPVCPVSAIFAVDDLPEKWQSYIEKTSSYVEGGKFQPEKTQDSVGRQRRAIENGPRP